MTLIGKINKKHTLEVRWFFNIYSYSVSCYHKAIILDVYCDVHPWLLFQ